MQLTIYVTTLRANFKTTLDMDKKSLILQTIQEQGTLPLFFYNDAEVSVEVLRALYRAGIRAFEYTNRGKAALHNFEALRKVTDAEMPGMYLGIGTMKNGQMAQDFVNAGTDFLVCPGLVESVAEVAINNNMLWCPGCMTPTEIIEAETLGANFVKLFPGNILGPGFVSAIKELFPNTSFMVTGGVDVTKENIEGWFKSGVSCVGMGSKLISKQLLEEKNYTKIESLTKEVMEIIKLIKK